MAEFRRWFQPFVQYVAVISFVGGASAQSCLVLSTPDIGADGTLAFSLSLLSSRGQEPSTVQWAFQYDSSVISNLMVDDGPALASTGKTVICRGNSGAYNCLAVGSNSNRIRNGIVARVTAMLTLGTKSAPISIHSSLGASPEGYFVGVIARVLDYPGASAPPACRTGFPPRGLIRQ